MIVFGVDVLKGSSRSRTSPKYALYVVENDREWSREVSKNRLLRYVREHKPDFIATDNIYELFKDKQDLISFLKTVEPKTKLVQTAGKHSLSKMAKRYGIQMDPKNPFDEARASALLVKYGVGDVVSVFGDRTIIKVSRNRSLGKGGWRQNKYRRKVHNSVRHVFREIKKILDERGIEYVEEVREGYGGLAKGILIIEQPRENVPINSFRLKDVQVRVEAIEKEKIEFVPLRKQQTYTIVGIDPGTTVGIAILDLEGNVLAVESKKGWGYSDVVEFALSFGKPLIIATDKKSPPEYILKMRASFNCILHSPKEDISVEKKKALTSRIKLLNDHERDALASAIDAYNSYKNKLKNIEKKIPEGFDADEIKAGIIRGLSLKSMLERAPAKEESGEVKIAEHVSIEEIRRRDRIIAKLKKENEILEKKIDELKKEIERLQDKIYSISSEEHRRLREKNIISSLQSEIKELKKEIALKDRKIVELERKIDEIRKARFLQLKGWRIVKLLRKFTKDEIERVSSSLGINEGDIVFIEDTSGGGANNARMIARKGIKAIIVCKDMSHYAKEVFELEKIPVISSERLRFMILDDYALVHSEDLEKELLKARELAEKRSIERIEKLIAEYKSARNRLIS